MATRWTVVGGQDAGGILVRDSCSLTSALKDERLSIGAIVEQLTFAANRLHFRRVWGKGPSDGWVSVTVNGRVLLKRSLSCGPQFIDLVKADNPNPVVSKRPVAKFEVAEKQQVYHADFCVKYACCIRPAGHQDFCVNNDLEEMRPAPKLGLYSGLAISASFPGDNINIHIMLQESGICLERTPTRSFLEGGSPPRQEFGTWVFQASTLTVKLSKEELQVRVGGLDSNELSLKGAVCQWQRPLNQEELDAMVEQLEVATLEKQRREAEERVAQEREAKIQAAWEREEAMEADVIRQRQRQLRREKVAEAARRVWERQHRDEVPRCLEGAERARTIQRNDLQLIVATGLNTCTFVSCKDDSFDTNGVLYALGTDFGKCVYTNPADSGAVRLLWSPDANNYYSAVGGYKQGDSKQAARIICANSHPGSNATQRSCGETGAWFAIDLISREVCVMHFAYRGDYGGGGNHPRTFELQGSNDGNSWTTLSVHNSESWSGKAAKHWPVQSKDQYFRILRIFNKGAPGHLCCSGIEFYGSVCDVEARSDVGSGSGSSGLLHVHAARYGWAGDLWSVPLDGWQSVLSDLGGVKDVTDIIKRMICGNELHINPSSQAQYMNRTFWPEMAGGPAVARKLAVRYSYGDGPQMTVETPAVPNETAPLHVTPQTQGVRASVIPAIVTVLGAEAGWANDSWVSDGSENYRPKLKRRGNNGDKLHWTGRARHIDGTDLAGDRPMYTHSKNSPLPPKSGWQVEFHKGIPAPTLEYDITPNPEEWTPLIGDGCGRWGDGLVAIGQSSYENYHFGNIPINVISPNEFIEVSGNARWKYANNEWTATILKDIGFAEPGDVYRFSRA